MKKARTLENARQRQRIAKAFIRFIVDTQRKV